MLAEVHVDCGSNIPQCGRNRRMRGGVAILALGLLAAIAVIKLQLPTPVRALVFVPFFGGSMMFFQAAFRTCVYRAFRRQREMAHGVETIANPERAKSYVAKARGVLLSSAAVAVAMTGALMMLP